MAQIKPFNGYIYDAGKVKDIASVLAPPYDVISPEAQEALYRRSEFNIVRLTLGKEEPGDNDSVNKYRRARQYLDEFIKKGVLVKDKTPSIYIYDQEYKTQAGKKNRTGFVALIKLEEPENNKVLPHERTFENPKKDRLKLMKSAGANLSAIFSIFDDCGGSITRILEKETQGEPVFDVLCDDVRQRLWRVIDSGIIATIEREMADKQVFIADGHHRYETALTYRNEVRAQKARSSVPQPYDYVMMYLAGMDEARLTVLATHRVVKDIGNLSKDNLLSLLGKYFDITEFTVLNDLMSVQGSRNEKFTCGMYCGGDGYYLLELKDPSVVSKVVKAAKSQEWKNLDVTLAHRLILKHILKVEEKADNIGYLREADLAVERVRCGECKLALLLNPTRLEQVRRIASAGEKMPHKSTYFYPKLLSGIVINKFD